MHRKRRSLAFVLISLIIVIVLLGVLRYHEVDNTINEEDREYIPKFVEKSILFDERNHESYENELGFIVKVQKSVLTTVYRKKGIPRGKKREPKELFLSKSGLGFDRSRVIEKILRYSGFKTRHVAIYSTFKTNSALKSLIKPLVYSHNVTEVLTSDGWLVVDSNYFWVSVDEQDKPVSIERIHSDVGTTAISWKEPLPSAIYTLPFTYVYGLYSRHGYFYPPFNFIPDVHYGELLQNILN
jgi:hypothetical protein